jgi:signal transduction histidine kinase
MKHCIVLLIEDNPDDRELVRRRLGQLKDVRYVCLDASSGEQGLVMIQQHRPDCVLLDYSLPGQDGIAALRQIRDIDPFVPVIMLTGQGNETLAVQAMKEGAVDYLAKSVVTAEALHRALGSAIERARQEKKIDEQRQRIAQQAEELERINRDLETFTYIASHDLRSPLINLKGFSSELRRSIDTVVPLMERALPVLSEDEQKILRREVEQMMPKALSYIANSAERMDRLTSAILKLSRLGCMEVAMGQIDTALLVKQCLLSFAHQIEKTGTTIEVGELPGIVGDRSGVEQIFGNLIDNALKYFESSRLGYLSITASESTTHITFCVKDNGRGIAEGDMHKVFEIFRRAGDLEGIAGEGMGMSYVRAIVKRHNGTIWCESKLGEGTAFYFTIARPEALQEAA